MFEQGQISRLNLVLSIYSSTIRDLVHLDLPEPPLKNSQGLPQRSSGEDVTLPLQAAQVPIPCWGTKFPHAVQYSQKEEEIPISPEGLRLEAIINL